MRNVVEKHAQSLGFAVDACSNYAQAAELLRHQFQKFGGDFSALIFGWPTTPQDDAAAFAKQLDISDHKDLAVVVMSTDMRAEMLAWVGARDKCEVLPWKDYQRLDELFRQLIDEDTDMTTNTNTDIGTLAGTKAQDGVKSGLLPVGATHQDIHLLIVDDSATIRLSLRDLFKKQGYQISLAATHDEAIHCASETAIDIVIIDYYLSDTTGDMLCRDMLASADTGDVVCTVLTGTYSDHIIRRSLRAGAIECMFKNESSELLISRIDAISRFIRQRHQLQNERQLLEDILESITGAVIVIDSEHRIAYTNTLALRELGLKDESVLMGQQSNSLLEQGGPQAPGETVYAANWQLPEDRVVAVDYQHSLIKNGAYTLLRFAQRTVPIANADLVVLQQSHDPDTMADNVIRQFSLLDQCKPFLLQLLKYLETSKDQQSHTVCPEQQGDSSMQVSLLVLDVSPAHDAQASVVQKALFGLAAQEHHVTAFGEHRYGFLLRHAEESQAYVLTRKVMQHCLQAAAEDDEGTTLVCRGSMLSLTRNADQPMNVLVQHVLRGMDLVQEREPNQALLLDVRRLLPAFPAEK